MTGKDLVRTGSIVRGEVLKTHEDFLRAAYGNSGTEAALDQYIATHSAEDSAAVETRLAQFCNVTAATALEDGEINVDLVRSAFDLVTDSMNEAASRRYGYESPRGVVQFLLVRAGVQAPQPRRYVRHLDDHYWSQQFMDQYKNGGMPMELRRPEETEQEYLARYTFKCLQGLVFAYFTMAV